jgi:hypothetical protein
MPAFDLLAYDVVSFKASHNSYQRDEDIHQQLAWDASSPAQGGCRGLEIDITRHSDSTGGHSVTYFQVSHDKGGEGIPLAAYLGYLLSFHLAAPSHDPVFVTLDIKSEEGDIDVFPGEIDAYLTEWFDPSLMFTPRHILCRARGDLGTTIAELGWPTVCELRGRFLFCLSGTESWKALYSATQPEQRHCFADFDVDDVDMAFHPARHGHRIVVNCNLFCAHFATWQLFPARCRTLHRLCRGYVLNSGGLWGKALTSGFNVLATDEVTGGSWAHVGSEPFVKVL